VTFPASSITRKRNSISFHRRFFAQDNIALFPMVGSACPCHCPCGIAPSRPLLVRGFYLRLISSPPSPPNSATAILNSSPFPIIVLFFFISDSHFFFLEVCGLYAFTSSTCSREAEYLVFLLYPTPCGTWFVFPSPFGKSISLSFSYFCPPFPFLVLALPTGTLNPSGW